MSAKLNPNSPMPESTRPDASVPGSVSKSIDAKPSFTDQRREHATTESREESFAEVALRLGGASDDEARRTGAVDAADDQVEDLFAPQYQTANSPAHRAVWDRHVPTELFQYQPDIQQHLSTAPLSQAILVG